MCHEGTGADPSLLRLYSPTALCMMSWLQLPYIDSNHKMHSLLSYLPVSCASLHTIRDGIRSSQRPCSRMSDSTRVDGVMAPFEAIGALMPVLLLMGSLVGHCLSASPVGHP